MRKVIASAFVSLDGIMQAPGGPEEDPTGGFAHGGWVAGSWHDELGEVIDRVFSRPYDLLLGRKTYEIFAAHWPHIGDDDPIARQFNTCRKFVATSSRAPLSWANSTALHDAATEVRKLKETEGPDLLVQGSSVLVQTLLAHDLLDEVTLLVFPLTLGSGKTFFGSGTRPGALAVVSSSVTPAGVLAATYRPAGPVKTASFALETPTEAETARRERMASEG
jgi:dihydrofolate reductase